MNVEDFASQSTARFFKIVDSTLPSHSQIISWGKWNVPVIDEAGQVTVGGDDADDLPQWPEGGDAELADEFFGELARRRAKIMEGRAHYYLEIVATLPEHQGESRLVCFTSLRQFSRLKHCFQEEGQQERYSNGAVLRLIWRGSSVIVRQDLDWSACMVGMALRLWMSLGRKELGTSRASW